MTINSTTRKAGPFVGNGTVSAFPFGFKVFQASDLFVVRLNVSAAVEQTLVLNSDYSVTLNPDQNSNPGGVVTLSSVLASGYTLTLTSDVPDTQPTDLTNQGGFYPEVINDALDRATIQIQQVQVDADRTIKSPLSLPAGVDMDFPLPEANQFIAWNSTGTGLQNLDGSSLASIVAFATAYADTFNGDGVTSTFALSYPPATVRNLDVSINGVTQVPVADYNINGQALNFTTPPPLGSVVLAKYWQALPNSSGAAQDFTLNPNGYTTAVDVQEGFDDLGSSTGTSKIGFIQAGTGAQTRSAQDKLRDTVSVKDFGAVGDGVADDATAINAAIAAVESAGGGVVQLHAGTFLVGATLALPDNVFLQGANQKATTIKLANAANVNIIEKKAGAVGLGAGLRDLTIDGNDANNTSGGVFWDGANNVRGPSFTFERVTVQYCRPVAGPPSGEYGAILTVGNVWGIARDLDVNQNQYAVGWWHRGSDWQIDGLYLGPNGAQYNGGAGAQSMIIQGGAGNLFTSCYFGGNGGLSQVFLWGSSRNLFVNCICDNSWQSAYQLTALLGNGSNGNRFIGGQISGASGRTNLGYPAVLIDNSNDNIFSDVLWQGSPHSTSGNKADYGFEEIGTSTGNGVIGGTLNVAFGTGFVNFGGASTSLVSNVVGYDESEMQIVVAKKQALVNGPFDNNPPSISSVPLLRLNGGGALSLWGGSYGYTSTWLQSIQDDGSNNLKELALNPLGGAVSIGGNGNGIKVTSPNGLVTKTISIDNAGNVVAV